MFNKTRLAELVALYKKYFNKDFPGKYSRFKRDQNSIFNHFTCERYKWVAVKNFQDTWDENATDFTAMFQVALSKAVQWLDMHRYGWAYTQILTISQYDSSIAKKILLNLFNEHTNIFERMHKFITEVKESLLKIKSYANNASYTNSMTIRSATIYVSLMYPDKYFTYERDAFAAIANYIEFKNIFKRFFSLEQYKIFNEFYAEVQTELKQDSELLEIIKSNFTEDMYADPELTLITADLAYFAYYYISELHVDKID